MAKKYKIKSNVSNYLDTKQKIHDKKTNPKSAVDTFKRRHSPWNQVGRPIFNPLVEEGLLESYFTLYNHGYSCAQLGLTQVNIGDLNNDGIVNVLDVVALANFVIDSDGWDPDNPTSTSFPCFTSTADVTQDGGANVLDIVTLVNCVLGTGQSDCSNIGTPAYDQTIPSEDDGIGDTGDTELGGFMCTNPEALNYGEICTDCEYPNCCCNYNMDSTDCDCSDEHSPFSNFCQRTFSIHGYDVDINSHDLTMTDGERCCYRCLENTHIIGYECVEAEDSECTSPNENICPSGIECPDGECPPDMRCVHSASLNCCVPDVPDNRTEEDPATPDLPCEIECRCLTYGGDSIVVDSYLGWFYDEAFRECHESSLLNPDVTNCEVQCQELINQGRTNSSTDRERDELGITWNFVGCPSGADFINNSYPIQEFGGYLDPKTGLPFVNHDYNCWRPSYENQPFYVEDEKGNPGPCLACYDPGSMEDPNGSEHPVPAYEYVCNGYSPTYLGDHTCGGNNGTDGTQDGGLGYPCTCVIKPEYVCASNPSVVYEFDNCNENCPIYDYTTYNGGDFCVERALSCCLHNFPHEWYDKFLNTYPTPPTFNYNENYIMNFYLERNGESVGNPGWRRIYDGSGDNPSAWEPDPNTAHGWDTLKCVGDVVTSYENGCGQYGVQSDHLIGNSCGDNNLGACVSAGGPYDQPIIAIFGDSSYECSAGSNLLDCSTCSGLPDNQDCDIRGLIPRLEHIPITEANSNFISSFFWMFFTFDPPFGYGDQYVGYVCDSGPYSGEGCNTNQDCGSIDGCEFSDEGCLHECVMNVTGPPTLFQQITFNDWSVGNFTTTAADWYHYIFFDNNSIGNYPTVPANCADDPFQPDCNRHRYHFPSDLKLDQGERLLIKIYDPQTHNDYVAGCINADLDHFGDDPTNPSVPNQIRYSVDINDFCNDATCLQYDDVNDVCLVFSAGTCNSNSERKCLEDKHCQLTSYVDYCNVINDEVVCDEHLMSSLSCLITGCTAGNIDSNGLEPCPEIVNQAAVIDDGSCFYPQYYCYDFDYDGQGCCTSCTPQPFCPEDMVEYCNVNDCDIDGDGNINWIAAGSDPDNPQNCDEACFCASNILDHCGNCVLEENDASYNYCYGELEGGVGGQCKCLTCSVPTENDPCKLVWDITLEEPHLNMPCGDGGVCVPNGTPPDIQCWDSTGVGSGFDCNGQCFGGYVDSCGSCAESINSNKILCHSDYDHDGLGCDPQLGFDCQQQYFCPTYNYICETNEDLDCNSEFENTCPCPGPEYPCWQNPFNGLDEFDDCNGFVDDCYNPHCSNFANDQTWYDCRGTHADGTIWCIDDDAYSNGWDGFKDDDCGDCRPMYCCDTSIGDLDCPSPLDYDPLHDTWLLSNGNHLVINPCTIFGDTWVVGNLEWNNSCVDCKGYPSEFFGAQEGHSHPIVVSEPHYYDATGTENYNHCCRSSETDVCGVCYNDDLTIYQWFPDHDNDGLGKGPVIDGGFYCGYSNTPSGQVIASPGIDENGNEIYPGLCGDDICCEVHDGGLGQDTTCCTKYTAGKWNSSHPLYGTPGWCYVVPGNPPTYTDFQNDVNPDQSGDFPDWVSYNNCSNILFTYPDFEGIAYCDDDELQYCATNATDCLENCYGPGIEDYEPVFDYGCGCGQWPGIYGIDVFGNGAGYGYEPNPNEYCAPEGNVDEGYEDCIPTNDGWAYCTIPGPIEISDCSDTSLGWVSNTNAGNILGGCFNDTADNHLPDRFPCLDPMNGSLRTNCDETPCLTVENINDYETEGACAWLNLLRPTLEENYYLGQSITVEINSDEGLPNCSLGNIGECFHNINPAFHSTNLAGVRLFRESDETDILIGSSTLEISNQVTQINPTDGWFSGDELYTYKVGIYYPDDGICNYDNKLACTGWDEISGLTIDTPLEGCMDRGTLPSCTSYCVQVDSEAETNVCVGGMADGEACSCPGDAAMCPGQDATGNCGQVGQQFVDCFPNRPALNELGQPYGYSTDGLNWELHAACNYDSTANINRNCNYRTIHGTDCDNDGFACQSDIHFGCPYGEAGDGYIGNHPHQGFPEPGCNYIELDGYDYEEVGNNCLCNATAHWNPELGIHSQVIGVCKDGYCEGGQLDSFTYGQSQCSNTIDLDNGGHVDCPNSINPNTNSQYRLGENIPAIFDSCNVCLDPMCGNYNPNLGIGVNPTNFQSLQAEFGTGSDTIDNPCTDLEGSFNNNIVPTNPNWNINCTGCMDTTAIEEYTCTTDSDPVTQNVGDCQCVDPVNDELLYQEEGITENACLSYGSVCEWTFVTTMIYSESINGSCTRPCNGAQLNNYPVSQMWPYGYSCSGVCKYNPFIECGICDGDDETCNDICRNSHQPAFENDQCMYEPFTYNDPDDVSGFFDTESIYFNEWIEEYGQDTIISSQEANCCCNYDYGCPDSNSANYRYTNFKDCGGVNYLKNCLFGLENGGIPVDDGQYVTPGFAKITITAGEINCNNCIENLAWNGGGNHSIKNNSYIRAGSEVMEITNLSPSNDPSARYLSATLGRGLFDTESVNHQSEDSVLVENKFYCNYDCCEAYNVIGACLDPSASNYYCWGDYGFDVTDISLCPGGVPPNFDDSFSDGFDHIYVTDCDGNLLTSDEWNNGEGDFTTSCCIYTYDCAGNPCVTSDCGYPSNAYYDFCGKCVGLGTGLAAGYHNDGCGCDDTDPRGVTVTEQLRYWADWDADGFGCEIDSDGNPVNVKEVNQDEVFDKIRADYLAQCEVWGIPLEFCDYTAEGRCFSDPRISCFAKSNPTSSDPEENGQVQCPGGVQDCMGYRHTHRYCPNCNDTANGYVPSGETTSDCVPDYHIAPWMGRYDTIEMGSWYGYSIPYTPAWWINNPNGHPDVPENPYSKPCEDDSDCIIYCPNIEDQAENVEIAVQDGMCQAGFCKFPGWVYATGACEVDYLDLNCTCHHNFVDCLGQCVDPADAQIAGSCGGCGSTAISCTSSYQTDGSQTDSYYVFNTFPCDENNTECSTQPYLCEDWIIENCTGNNPDPGCSDFNEMDYYPNTDIPATEYLYNINTTLPGSHLRIKPTEGDATLENYYCNFKIIDCLDEFDEPDNSICELYGGIGSQCNQYGYCDIVNGFDCFCDCRTPGEDNESAAQLDSCMTCHGGNTDQINSNFVPADVLACRADHTNEDGFLEAEHDPENYIIPGGWQYGLYVDCMCECRVGTEKFRQIHSQCPEEYSQENSDEWDITTQMICNYGLAGMTTPLGTNYVKRCIDAMGVITDIECQESSECIELGYNGCTQTLTEYGCGGEDSQASDWWTTTCGCTGGNVPFTEANADHKSDSDWCFQCSDPLALENYDPLRNWWCFDDDGDGTYTWNGNCYDCSTANDPQCREFCPNSCQYQGCLDPYAINYNSMALVEGGECIYRWNWNNLQGTCTAPECEGDEPSWYLYGDEQAKIISDRCDGCTGGLEWDDPHFVGGKFRVQDWYCLSNQSYYLPSCGIHYDENYNDGPDTKLGINSKGLLDNRFIPMCDGVNPPTNDDPSTLEIGQCVDGECETPQDHHLYTGVTIDDLPVFDENNPSTGGHYTDLRLFAHDFTFRSRLDGLIIDGTDPDKSFTVVLGPEGPTTITNTSSVPDDVMDSDSCEDGKNYIKLEWNLSDYIEAGDCENINNEAACDAAEECGWNNTFQNCHGNLDTGYYNFAYNWFHFRVSFLDDPACVENSDGNGCVDGVMTHVVVQKRDQYGDLLKLPVSKITTCGDAAEIVYKSPKYFGFYHKKKFSLPEVDCLFPENESGIYNNFKVSDGCKLKDLQNGNTYYGACNDPSPDNDTCDCSRGSYGKTSIYGHPADDNYMGWNSILLDDFKVVSSGFAEGGGRLTITDFKPINNQFGFGMQQVTNFPIAPLHRASLHNINFDLAIVDDLSNCDLTHGILTLGNDVDPLCKATQDCHVGFYANECMNNDLPDSETCDSRFAGTDTYNPYYPGEYKNTSLQPISLRRCWSNRGQGGGWPEEYQVEVDTPQSGGWHKLDSDAVVGGAGMTVDEHGLVTFENIGNPASYWAMNSEWGIGSISEDGTATYYDYLDLLIQKNKLYSFGDGDMNPEWYGGSGERAHYIQPYPVNEYNYGVNLGSVTPKIGQTFCNPEPRHYAETPNDGRCNAGQPMFRYLGFPNLDTVIGQPSPRDRFDMGCVGDEECHYDSQEFTGESAWTTESLLNNWNGYTSNHDILSEYFDGDIENPEYSQPFNPAKAAILHWPTAKAQDWDTAWKRLNFPQAADIVDQYFVDGSYYYILVKATGDSVYYSEYDCDPYYDYVDDAGIMQDVIDFGMSIVGEETVATPQNQGCFDTWGNIRRDKSIWSYPLPKTIFAEAWKSGVPTYVVWYYSQSEEWDTEEANTACSMVLPSEYYNCVALRAPQEFLRSGDGGTSDVNWNYYPDYMAPIDHPVWTPSPTTANTTDPDIVWNKYGSLGISMAVMIEPPQLVNSYKINDVSWHPNCECACGRVTPDENNLCPDGQVGVDNICPLTLDNCSDNCLPEDFTSQYIIGCTDIAADNYCPQATYDNGSCAYESTLYMNTCPIGDGVVEGDALNCDGYCLAVPAEGQFDINTDEAQCVEVYGGVAADKNQLEYILNHPERYTRNWVRKVRVNGLTPPGTWGENTRFNVPQIAMGGFMPDGIGTWDWDGQWNIDPFINDYYYIAEWEGQIDWGTPPAHFVYPHDSIHWDNTGKLEFPILGADQIYGNEYNIIIPGTFKMQMHAYECPTTFLFPGAEGYCGDYGILDDLFDDGCCLDSPQFCDNNMTTPGVPVPGDYCDEGYWTGDYTEEEAVAANVCGSHSRMCIRDCLGTCRDIGHFEQMFGQCGDGWCDSPSIENFWEQEVCVPTDEWDFSCPIELACEAFNFECGDCVITDLDNNDPSDCGGNADGYSCKNCELSNDNPDIDPMGYCFDPVEFQLGDDLTHCSCQADCVTCEAYGRARHLATTDWLTTPYECMAYAEELVGMDAQLCCMDTHVYGQTYYNNQVPLNSGTCHNNNFISLMYNEWYGCDGISDCVHQDLLGCTWIDARTMFGDVEEGEEEEVVNRTPMCPGTPNEPIWRDMCIQTTGWDPMAPSTIDGVYQGDWINPGDAQAWVSEDPVLNSLGGYIATTGDYQLWGMKLNEAINLVHNETPARQEMEVCCCNYTAWENWQVMTDSWWDDFVPGCLDKRGYCLGDPQYVAEHWTSSCPNPRVHDNDAYQCQLNCALSLSDEHFYWTSHPGPDNPMPIYVGLATNFDKEVTWDPAIELDDGTFGCAGDDCQQYYDAGQRGSCTYIDEMDDWQTEWNSEAYRISLAMNEANIECEDMYYPHSCPFNTDVCDGDVWPGDCVDVWTYPDGSTCTSNSGMIPLKSDLYGNCFPETWIGDGFCDNGRRNFVQWGALFMYPDPESGYPDGYLPGENVFQSGQYMSDIQPIFMYNPITNEYADSAWNGFVCGSWDYWDGNYSFGGQACDECMLELDEPCVDNGGDSTTFNALLNVYCSTSDDPCCWCRNWEDAEVDIEMTECGYGLSGGSGGWHFWEDDVFVPGEPCCQAWDRDYPQNPLTIGWEKPLECEGDNAHLYIWDCGCDLMDANQNGQWDWQNEGASWQGGLYYSMNSIDGWVTETGSDCEIFDEECYPRLMNNSRIWHECAQGERTHILDPFGNPINVWVSMTGSTGALPEHAYGIHDRLTVDGDCSFISEELFPAGLDPGGHKAALGMKQTGSGTCNVTNMCKYRGPELQPNVTSENNDFLGGQVDIDYNPHWIRWNEISLYEDGIDLYDNYPMGEYEYSMGGRLIYPGDYWQNQLIGLYALGLDNYIETQFNGPDFCDYMLDDDQVVECSFWWRVPDRTSPKGFCYGRRASGAIDWSIQTNTDPSKGNWFAEYNCHPEYNRYPGACGQTILNFEDYCPGMTECMSDEATRGPNCYRFCNVDQALRAETEEGSVNQKLFVKPAPHLRCENFRRAAWDWGNVCGSSQQWQDCGYGDTRDYDVFDCNGNCYFADHIGNYSDLFEYCYDGSPADNELSGMDLLCPYFNFNQCACGFAITRDAVLECLNDAECCGDCESEEGYCLCEEQCVETQGEGCAENNYKALICEFCPSDEIDINFGCPSDEFIPEPGQPCTCVGGSSGNLCTDWFGSGYGDGTIHCVPNMCYSDDAIYDCQGNCFDREYITNEGFGHNHLMDGGCQCCSNKCWDPEYEYSPGCTGWRAIRDFAEGGTGLACDMNGENCLPPDPLWEDWLDGCPVETCPAAWNPNAAIYTPAAGVYNQFDPYSPPGLDLMCDAFIEEMQVDCPLECPPTTHIYACGGEETGLCIPRCYVFGENDYGGCEQIYGDGECDRGGILNTEGACTDQFISYFCADDETANDECNEFNNGHDCGDGGICGILVTDDPLTCFGNPPSDGILCDPAGGIVDDCCLDPAFYKKRAINLGTAADPIWQCINLNCEEFQNEWQGGSGDCSDAASNVYCDGINEFYDCSPLTGFGVATNCFSWDDCIQPILDIIPCVGLDPDEEEGCDVCHTTGAFDVNLPDGCNGVMPNLNCLCSPNGMTLDETGMIVDTQCVDWFFECDRGKCGTFEVDTGVDPFDGSLETGRCVQSCEQQANYLVTDCNGVCQNEEYLADGTCHDGRYDGPNFLCEQNNWDGVPNSPDGEYFSPCCLDWKFGDEAEGRWCPSLYGEDGEDAEFCDLCVGTVSCAQLNQIEDCDGNCIDPSLRVELQESGNCIDGSGNDPDFLCESAEDGTVYNYSFGNCCSRYCDCCESYDDLDCSTMPSELPAWCNDYCSLTEYDGELYGPNCDIPCYLLGHWQDCDGNCYSPDSYTFPPTSDGYCDKGEWGPNLFCLNIVDPDGNIFLINYDLPDCCRDLCTVDGVCDFDLNPVCTDSCSSISDSLCSCACYNWTPSNGTGSCEGLCGEPYGSDDFCSCSPECVDNGDCCCDFCTVCEDIVPECQYGYDCDYQCIDAAIIAFGLEGYCNPGEQCYAVQGDGYCDDGVTGGNPNINFICSEFNYDDGDCCEAYGCQAILNCWSGANDTCSQMDYCVTEINANTGQFFCPDTGDCGSNHPTIPFDMDAYEQVLQVDETCCQIWDEYCESVYCQYDEWHIDCWEAWNYLIGETCPPRSIGEPEGLTYGGFCSGDGCYIRDCDGVCCPQNWVNDGYCDGESAGDTCNFFSCADYIADFYYEQCDCVDILGDDTPSECFDDDGGDDGVTPCYNSSDCLSGQYCVDYGENVGYCDDCGNTAPCFNEICCFFEDSVEGDCGQACGEPCDCDEETQECIDACGSYIGPSFWEGDCYCPCVDCNGNNCEWEEENGWPGDGYCDSIFDCTEWLPYEPECEGLDCDAECNNYNYVGYGFESNGCWCHCIDCGGFNCDGYEYLVGNGECDDGSYYIHDYYCSEFNYDEGDCDDDGGGDDCSEVYGACNSYDDCCDGYCDSGGMCYPCSDCCTYSDPSWGSDGDCFEACGLSYEDCGFVSGCTESWDCNWGEYCDCSGYDYGYSMPGCYPCGCTYPCEANDQCEGETAEDVCSCSSMCSDRETSRNEWDWYCPATSPAGIAPLIDCVQWVDAGPSYPDQEWGEFICPNGEGDLNSDLVDNCYTLPDDRHTFGFQRPLTPAADSNMHGSATCNFNFINSDFGGIVNTGWTGGYLSSNFMEHVQENNLLGYVDFSQKFTRYDDNSVPIKCAGVAGMYMGTQAALDQYHWSIGLGFDETQDLFTADTAFVMSYEYEVIDVCQIQPHYCYIGGRFTR